MHCLRENADRLGNSDLFRVALFYLYQSHWTEGKESVIMKFKQWNGFSEGEWQEKINVRDFIDKNYTPYTGDASFL